MDVHKIKDEAESLYSAYTDKYDESASAIARRFLHLVYAFDPNCHIYREMTKESSSFPGLCKYDEEPKRYMEDFIDLLETIIKTE